MTEHVLVWHPKVPGDSVPMPSAGTEEPQLLGMPMLRPGKHVLDVDQLTPRARAVVEQILTELRARAVDPAIPTARLGLATLDEADKASVADILGEGDVWAKVGYGDRYWRVVESVLPGVWRIESSDTAGRTEEFVDVGACPLPVLQASRDLPQATIDIPTQWPHGAMNAPSLLHELQERSAQYQPGSENHVINFTLLPLTEADSQVLTGVLGQIPLMVRSSGYASTRVFATALRHVWAVQYVNNMGGVVLDTLEVGGVPVSVLAAKEDFEDSAERLGEILKAFPV
jgi:hydrogenase-1 operon protein HyaF